MRQARRRRIKIVTFQWLEDSLMRKNRRPLPTLSSKYNWEQRSIVKKRTRLQLLGDWGDEKSNGNQRTTQETKAPVMEDAEADKVEKFGKASGKSESIADVLTS